MKEIATLDENPIAIGSGSQRAGWLGNEILGKMLMIAR
jgi:hypothetical protein